MPQVRVVAPHRDHPALGGHGLVRVAGALVAVAAAGLQDVPALLGVLEDLLRLGGGHRPNRAPALPLGRLRPRGLAELVDVAD
eukprot:13547400-Alexandrium_andersonii.AAC.1